MFLLAETTFAACSLNLQNEIERCGLSRFRAFFVARLGKLLMTRRC